MRSLEPRNERFLVSPDGMSLALVDPQDPPNPKHAHWVDCTDMSNADFHAFIVERQGIRPYIVGVAIGA